MSQLNKQKMKKRGGKGVAAKVAQQKTAISSVKPMQRKERDRLKNPEKFDLADKVKKIWEELRCAKSLTLEKRQLLANELMTVIKGNATKLVSAHDTSRVLQTLLKYGSVEQRDIIFEEMKSSFATLMVQKYAAHYLMKVLEYGSTNHRQFIVRCIVGNTRGFLKNANAYKIVEEVFNKYAKPAERRQLLGDLLGATFRRLMKSGDETFRQVYLSTSDEEIKSRLLSSAKSTLVWLASCGKGRIAHLTIVHFALDEFLTCCPCENPLRQEVMDAWRENIHGLLSSKTGSRCACHFLWESDAKGRKAILKLVKPIIGQLCHDPDASLFIYAILNTVDDVVLINKLVLKCLMGKKPADEALEDDAVENLLVDGLLEAFMDPAIRRFFLYILSPLDPHHFSPAFCAQLKSPVLPNGQPLFLKKPLAEKMMELRRIARLDDCLLTFWLENMPTMLKELDNDGFLAFVTMMNRIEGCNGKRSRVFALFSYMVDPKADSSNVLSIESPVMNMALKRLIAGDKLRLNEEKDSLLAVQFVKMLTKESKEFVPAFLSSNRGCYLLVQIVEAEIEDSADLLVKQLKSKYLPLLSDCKTSGAKLLMQKICN